MIWKIRGRDVFGKPMEAACCVAALSAGRQKPWNFIGTRAQFEADWGTWTDQDVADKARAEWEQAERDGRVYASISEALNV